MIRCGFLAVALSVSVPPVVSSASPSADMSGKQAFQFPVVHPYLMLTPADVERAKQRAAQLPWAAETLQELSKNAERLSDRRWEDLPPKGDKQHWRIADDLRTVGLGYAFGGSAKQAEWVRDGLLAYADLYPQLAWTNRRCRVFDQSSLYEAMWAQSIVAAYDLVADSGVFADEQKRRFERDVLRLAVECFLIKEPDQDARIRDLHYRCYNFQAWHLGTIGLIGMALRDAQLVDYAVNSRYGFKHLLAHDVRDDGLFWERSAGYHHFVLDALLPFTEAALHCGVDLYQLQVPNDRSRDEDCHYVTDTSDAPKSLRMMFQAPFYVSFPDLSYMALGDSDRGPLRPDWRYLVAWNRYRDPHLHWLFRRETGFGDGVGFLHYYRYRFQYESVRLNGRPVSWLDDAGTYSLDEDRIIADDEGVSQSDHYLLTTAPGADFALDWTMTRLEDRGPQERACLVFQVNPHNTDFRHAYFLNSYLPETGRRYAFRLAVKDGQSQLLRDGTVLSSKPVVYHDRARRDWHWLTCDLPDNDDGVTTGRDHAVVWRDQTVGNTGVFRNGCTLMPASGVAVLREKPGDFTADRNATAVALSYGPYGGGHGHPDKLSIAVYAQGHQWIPHYGSMPYESTWKSEWTSHTVSHNTVVVDGVSQEPAGQRNAMWPVDTGQHRVVGELNRFDAEERLVSASCTSAYPQLDLHRTVRIWRHCVVDVFDVGPAESRDSNQPPDRQFDYVLHIDGRFAESTPSLAVSTDSLGDQCGYQHLRSRASTTATGTACLTFGERRRQLRIWVLPQTGPVSIHLADGLAASPTDLRPVLILRQRGIKARFATVIEPVVTKAPLTRTDVEAVPMN
jgi:hypothetical protein